MIAALTMPNQRLPSNFRTVEYSRKLTGKAAGAELLHRVTPSRYERLRAKGSPSPGRLRASHASPSASTRLDFLPASGVASTPA